MKFISWNVNGFRAVLGKGFADIFAALDADIFCLQETKMQVGQADFAPEGYESYWFSAERKGYSGTAVFTKKKPLAVTYGIEGKHADEDRNGGRNGENRNGNHDLAKLLLVHSELTRTAECTD